MRKGIESITRHSEYSEKAIERYLRTQVEALGGLCLKYSNPNMAGYPDRLVCLPGGRAAWVELKSKGKKPNGLQLARMAELMGIGHEVHVVDSRQGVDELVKRWRDENNM